MRGRKPDRFVLKRKDKVVLQELLREGQTSLRVARRAQILLGRAEGQQQRVKPLSERVAQAAATLWRVCKRYRTKGLEAALYDAPCSGRPRVFFQK